MLGKKAFRVQSDSSKRSNSKFTTGHCVLRRKLLTNNCIDSRQGLAEALSALGIRAFGESKWSHHQKYILKCHQLNSGQNIYNNLHSFAKMSSHNVNVFQVATWLAATLSEKSRVLTNSSSPEFQESMKRWSDIDVQIPSAIFLPGFEDDVVKIVRNPTRSMHTS